jgi:hypothetical protein
MIIRRRYARPAITGFLQFSPETDSQQTASSSKYQSAGEIPKTGRF